MNGLFDDLEINCSDQHQPQKSEGFTKTIKTLIAETSARANGNIREYFNQNC
ncbi:hypothetical protein SynMITS9220_02924 [Synechococcus sp. MIT S9220]|nr:hypothetical protein SynMITS9220_02924 [Synechococcus sp. MIT S9220]